MNERQRYQLNQRALPVGVQYWGVKAGKPEGSNGGFLLAGQAYTVDDSVAVLQWLLDRERGYPSLKKFEGGKLWPAKDIGGGPLLYPATCCKCGKVDWRERPAVGVYFCGYGCT